MALPNLEFLPPNRTYSEDDPELGFTDTEISEVMGCKPCTVRGHVFRALAALRVELGAPLPAAAMIKEGR